MNISDDWRDKIAAQQRHEHLAATVRIVVGELCFLAEQNEDVAERVYGLTGVLEEALKEQDVSYGGA